jgi:cobyrinic acid a,c-diamide synthase
MYLCRQITWKDTTQPMVGAIQADVMMHPRPQGRGYVRLLETDESPWPTAGDAGTGAEFPAHEFHYSALENIDGSPRFAYKVMRGTGIDGQHDGLVYKNLLACYTHLRDTDYHHWAQRFVSFIRQHKAH